MMPRAGKQQLEVCPGNREACAGICEAALTLCQWVTRCEQHCVPRQVSVRILGGLMALGYEIGTIMKRTSIVYADSKLTIKLDTIDGMGGQFVQVCHLGCTGLSAPSMIDVNERGQSAHAMAVPEWYAKAINLGYVRQYGKLKTSEERMTCLCFVIVIT